MNINATTAVVRKKYQTLNKHVHNSLYSQANHTHVRRVHKTINQGDRLNILHVDQHHSSLRRHTTNSYKRLTLLDNTHFYLLPMSKIASLERRVLALEANG